MNRLFCFFLLLAFHTPSSFLNAQQYDKMSGYIQRVLLRQRLKERKSGNGNNAARLMCAFVQCDDKETLRRYDATVNASWRDIHIVTMPISRIGELSLDARVRRIEASAPCSATVDFTAHQLNVDKVWHPSQIGGVTALRNSGYTGRGVVVGVQDIGFDLTHPSYYNDDMTEYRIKAFWDQLELDEEGTGMPVGRDYTSREALLQKAHAFDGLIVAHGTHTSTTAAGSGCEGYGADGSVHHSQYVGMAPEAELCLVANATTNAIEVIPEERRELYTSATDVLGFKYIFDYADAVGKPCVINFSEGSREDLYGEDKLMFEVLGQMVGPGRIICSSAGNNALQQTYMHKRPGDNSVGTFLVGNGSGMGCTISSSTSKTVLQLDFCETGSHDSQHILRSISFSVDDVLACKDSMLIDTVYVGDRRYAVLSAAFPSCYDEKRIAAELYVENVGKGRLSLSDGVALTLKGDDIECYASMGYFYNNGEDAYSSADKTHNINAPANAPSVIAVGMTGYIIGHENYLGEWKESIIGVEGERCPYSSVGPTMMGLIKPDVMAPGANVVAGMSSYYLEARPEAADVSWDVRHFEADGGAPEGRRTYGWNSNSGTSMSCPVMAGIVALWLEACPTLTREQIMETVAATATHYDPSLTYPNNEYGYGEVDALAGMEYILAHFVTGIESPSEVSVGHDNPIYDLYGRRITQPLRGHLYVRGGRTFVSK